MNDRQQGRSRALESFAEAAARRIIADRHMTRAPESVERSDRRRDRKTEKARAALRGIVVTHFHVDARVPETIGVEHDFPVSAAAEEEETLSRHWSSRAEPYRAAVSKGASRYARRRGRRRKRSRTARGRVAGPAECL